MKNEKTSARVAKKREPVSKETRALQRRVNLARVFPVNTCPASRHLHMIADALARGETYHMLTEEPDHCASTMYSVLLSLWTLRTKHPPTPAEKAREKTRIERAFARILKPKPTPKRKPARSVKRKVKRGGRA